MSRYSERVCKRRESADAKESRTEGSRQRGEKTSMGCVQSNWGEPFPCLIIPPPEGNGREGSGSGSLWVPWLWLSALQPI